MDPTPSQFAKLAKDCVITNPFNVTSPTILATGTNSPRRYRQVIQHGGSAAGASAAMATSADTPVGLNNADKSHGKRGRRKRQKNGKKHNPHTVTNTNRVRVRNRKRKKNSITAPASPECVRISSSGAGTQSNSKKLARKEKNRRKRKEKKERRLIEFQKLLESQVASESAVDRLVGLMEGFGICAGERVQEEKAFKVGRQGMDMDMDMDMDGLG
ncbi:hypothetical protein HOY82DRAFT_597048 [Tuber indicum]|nr:hypothetical protein HOY82DRAFT_597048 [Tuber indicum]